MKKLLTILFLFVSTIGFSQIGFGDCNIIVNPDSICFNKKLVVANITGTVKTFTNNTKDTICSIVCNSDSVFGGNMPYTIVVIADNGKQLESANMKWGGGQYLGVSFGAAPSGGTQYKTSGTLTVTWSWVYLSGYFYLMLNANSTLTNPVIYVWWRYDQSAGGKLTPMNN